jgi:hypothetical protein
LHDNAPCSPSGRLIENVLELRLGHRDKSGCDLRDRSLRIGIDA